MLGVLHVIATTTDKFVSDVTRMNSEGVSVVQKILAEVIAK
jgi:hypothetical protein